MKCTVCPRGCRVDRDNNEIGYCGESNRIRVARAALHMWEEPCISGEEGSGTIFFTGCNLGCVFCQNYALSRSDTGKVITEKRLTEIFLELQAKGANNINLVTPTHFVEQIIPALLEAKKKGLKIPIIYNNGGYESVDTLRLLDGLIDIYLPDFKYWDNSLGKRYSAVNDYRERAICSVEEMFRQTGAFRFDKQGIMQNGMIVRHLVLPGQEKDSKKILKYLYQTYGDQIYMSIMNQYTPLCTLDQSKYPELGRRVTEKEYDSVIGYAIELGIENAFIQEGETAKESFIPEFTCEGI